MLVHSGWISIVLFATTHSYSQTTHAQEITVTDNLVTSVNNFRADRPLISFEVNGKTYHSDSSTLFKVEFKFLNASVHGIEGSILLTNHTKDTLVLSNVVPFGRNNCEVYITGFGNHALSRTHLFLSDRKPINVIVPDNAWELGYTGIKLTDELKLFGFVKRDVNSLNKATRKRFETIVHPGGSVAYNFYTNFYTEDWQEGLREVFQKRKLYAIPVFDETLFKRTDLAWIRKAYVMHLMMAWDKDFYDAADGKYHLKEFIDKGKKLYGGDDAICIWPTWPTLGVDQRNQFDLYRDLPGGLSQLHVLAHEARSRGVKFFIAYNPWDESTRSEGHLQGLADLIKATSADGVVLDTKGESSKELQATADQVRPGVVMYSEGMAVPKDMQGIISGRVHNALYYPPLLNLNKFIRPDFAILRVAEVFKEPILREYAVAFFNGYGTEINQFAPGHPEWEEEQYRFLGMTTRILREHSDNFTTSTYTPLIKTLHDSVWVNQWERGEKTLYTIFSLKTEGFNKNLFEVNATNNTHWIDLWKHQEVELKKVGNKLFAVADIDGFDSRFLGTNNEGSVSCIGQFKKIIKAHIVEDLLVVKISSGTTVKIWKGNPSYEKKPIELPMQGDHFEISMSKQLNRYEGKIVIQAFRNDELIDESILYLKPGTPRMISTTTRTPEVFKKPSEMVMIPSGTFQIHFTQGDEFIPYPKTREGETLTIPSFMMDRYPVTNTSFKKFMDATRYQPIDTTNFLKHWKGNQIVEGEEDFPVTYVSYEDAQAYATWAQKRLPTEIEWQYAAQTSSLNEWPWKQRKPVTRKETFVTETLTIKSIEGIDSKNCNLGSGQLYPVGKYKKGVNPHGLYDLVGSVWQLTNDVYENGSYHYIMLKGGSYFKPSSSWWYVQGGPRELHYRQILLRVSQSFERNATVGFRCMKD
ncbi:MAG: formylglycine-generating enzyme family protein [Cyclobacteriaceae bacterium]|nr:formylglycine-generating enzyme family protein [Cyclobacteriaceae bacterium]